MSNLPIVEEGRNLPSVLGRRNIPTERPWPITRRLATIPAVRGLGREPPLLPQRDISVQVDEDVKSHNIQGQLTKYPIFPILDRPKPILDWLKARNTLIPRAKLIGAFGLVDPQLRIAEERPIGTIPKPMSILSGPRHPMSPQKISVEW